MIDAMPAILNFTEHYSTTVYWTVQ